MMKVRHRIAGLGLLLSLCLPAQKAPELAFSKSYSFEYETQYAKAIAALEETGSDNYQVNLRLGWLHYLNKSYARSEQYYRKAVGQEPGSVEARFGMALPLSATGNWNEVLDTYLEILKIDPNNSIANYRTASIYYNRREYVDASAYLAKVIRMYPFDYDSNLLNGKILVASGKSEEARKFLEKALQYNPQSAEVKAALKKL
jgi:tetratricopeptide (TPR) repeat protein